MPKEWIDVADTAVKIGLGAAITGVFTYLGVKASSRSEKQKYTLEHKVKLLEQASEDVETFFRSFDSYISQVAGVTKHKKQSNTETAHFTDRQKEVIGEQDRALAEGVASLASAISRLRLLKAHHAVEALNEFNIIGKEIRNKIVFAKEVPTYDEVVAVKARAREQMKEVHEALADFYEALQV